MKLRNKKTGEIVDIIAYETKKQPLIEGIDYQGQFENLAELNEEWEDYEENEYYYAITSIKADDGITKIKNKHNDMTAFDKAIGNYFGTKEEAEKAVEKLKALKRLKDKGFERVFSLELADALCGGKTVEFKLLIDNKDSIEDIKLLFGGEE